MENVDVTETTSYLALKSLFCHYTKTFQLMNEIHVKFEMEGFSFGEVLVTQNTRIKSLIKTVEKIFVNINPLDHAGKYMKEMKKVFKY